MGKAETDAVGKQQHTPAHHHYDVRVVAYTYGAPLIVAAALRRHTPARPSWKGGRLTYPATRRLLDPNTKVRESKRRTKHLLHYRA